MAVGNDKDIKIQITVDNSGAVTALRQIGDETENLGKQAKEEIKKGFSFTELNQGVELAKSAFRALQGVITTAFEGIKKGSDVNDVTDAFQNLAASSGISSDRLLANLQRASAGTISNFELMAGANKTLQAGLKPEVFEEVIKAARAYSDQVGGDSVEKINQFTNSILRDNEAAFKSIGIKIDTTAAELRYANSLGIAREALTEAQKTEISRSAALDALREKTAQLGEANIDAGDKTESLSVSFENFTNAISSTLAKSPALNNSLNVLKSILQDLEESNVAQTIGTVLSQSFKVVTESALILYGALSEVADNLIIIGKIASSVANGINPIKAFTQAVSELDKEGNARILYIRKTIDSLNAEAKATNNSTKENKNALDAKKNLNKEDISALKAQNDLIKAIPEEEKAYQDLFRSLGDIIEGSKDVRLVVEDTISAYKQGAITFDGAKEQLINIAKAYQEIGRTSKDVIPEVTRGLNEIKNATPEQGFFHNIFSVKSLQEFQAELGLLQTGIGAIKQVAGGNTASVVQGITTLIGGIFGAIYGGTAGAAAGAGIGNAIGGLFEKETLVSILKRSAEDAEKVFGSEVGGAISNILTKIVKSLTDSDATIIRKSIDKYFADLFNKDRILAVVNGQLKQITDLEFQGPDFGNRDKGFFAALETLPAAAQAAFKGVAEAFAQITGLGEGLGLNLAAVFANNVGPSLNNLQLLIEATGKSLEDLSKAIVDSFLDGKLSFIEAETALINLKKVFETGIPDAVGATTLAFQNLIDAGRKGGRASVDALRDLGAEAQELNLRTLDDLRNNLTASGQFTVEQIASLFQRLKENGITSLEQLKNLSNEAAIAILSSLEAAGFQFKETANQTQDVIDKVAEIPSRQVKDLIFRVDVQAIGGATTTFGQQALIKGDVKLPVGVSQ